MEVKKTLNESELLVELEGRLDTNTAPQLEEELGNLDEVNSLKLDLVNLDYISSAGLRVLLALTKTMSKKGGMVITNVKPEIMEVFEMTGFTDILTIE